MITVDAEPPPGYNATFDEIHLRRQHGRERTAESTASSAETAAAKRARALAAAAANEPAAGAAARPSNDAVYALVRTRLLALPSKERAGFIEEFFAEDPDVLAALRNKFADLLAEPVAESMTDTANAAAREAAKAAAKKITDLRAQLVAKHAEKDAAVREAAEAVDEKIVALRAQLAADQAKVDAAREADAADE